MGAAPTDANLLMWLLTTKNEILHTDGVRTNAMDVGGPSGTHGLLAKTHVIT